MCYLSYKTRLVSTVKVKSLVSDFLSPLSPSTPLLPQHLCFSSLFPYLLFLQMYGCAVDISEEAVALTRENATRWTLPDLHLTSFTPLSFFPFSPSLPPKELGYQND